MPSSWDVIVDQYVGRLSDIDRRELESLGSDSIRAGQLEAIIVDIATYNSGNKSLFAPLRAYFINEQSYQDIVPAWLKANRDPSGLRSYMQQDNRGYRERRALIQEGLAALHDACERGAPGASPAYDPELFTGYESVEILWQKAQRRLENDPPGAITAARSMLESLFKHILDERSVGYTSAEDTISLYRKVQGEFGLLPANAATEPLRQFMSGCASIVNGIANFRNASGDAHGRGQDYEIVPTYFAELEVDMAGTLARFLVEYLRDGNVRGASE